MKRNDMQHSTNAGSAVENLGPSIGYRPEDRTRYESILSFLNISKRILKKRFELGLSQEALGKLAGSKQAKVSDLELMKGNPRLKTLDQIARKLGLVVDLVPIEDSLRGSPFERAPLATAQAMMPRGSQVASASKKELIGVGASKDYDWMPGGVF